MPDNSPIVTLHEGYPAQQNPAPAKPTVNVKSGGNYYTTASGCPIQNPMAWERMGRIGPLLLQDTNLIEILAHFARERIPERVVHAKAVGAHGYFEVTKDITHLTDADFLSEVGKRSPVFCRISTVGGERGSADGARDPRGFSTKIYTNEGNLDWVFNNTPVFFIRNPTKFPEFIHTQKRNPQTNLKDHTMFWDWLTSNTESAHQVMQLFSDRGTPYGFHHMHNYSGHTYKLTKGSSFVYVKVHNLVKGGFKTLTQDEANAEDADYGVKLLFDDIEAGRYPEWTSYIQTMTPEQAEKLNFSIFDMTKTWPKKDFPLQEFGRYVLNRNPQNYFDEVEQAAFSPSNIVPGWEPSADPVLQSRLFSYPDTQRYRLGANFQRIAINSPLRSLAGLQRDGHGPAGENYGSLPNYLSTVQPYKFADVRPPVENEEWQGKVITEEWINEGMLDDFSQATDLWHVLGRTPGQQENFINNVATHACDAIPEIRKRVYEFFTKVDPALGKAISEATEKNVKK